MEYGFVDNVNDAERLKQNEQDYASATVRAVLDYIGYIESDTNTYTVKAGDSLYSIAKKYNITVDELKTENNLTSNLISIGQVLKIPTKTTTPDNYLEYIVKPGDSLYRIALNNNTTVDELVDFNNLSSTALSIGQIIKIPVTEPPTEPEQPEPTPPTTQTYTVKAGDSLYSIAKQFNTTVDSIKKQNNLTSDLLSIGQVLQIPSNDSTEIILYTVKSGDNLYKIANQFNTTVDSIKKQNNLSTDLLSIGQVLQIPSNNTEMTYTVKAGDSLYSIANRYNTTVDNLINKNNLTSTLLSIGQVLKI